MNVERVRWSFAAAIFGALLGAACATSTPSSKPELCPMCQKPVDDGPEVRVVRAGELGEGSRYRCFVCPIMQGTTGEDWTMHATSGLDGKLVVFHVHGDTATSDPPTAVVLALPVAPGAECLDVHRVFVDRDEFERYAATHPLALHADARRIDDVLVEMRHRGDVGAPAL
jgi:hypothetical protein